MKLCSLMFMICMMTLFATGQNRTLCPPSSIKKANKYYDEAMDARKNHKEYKVVKEYCEKAIEQDSAFAQAWHLLGDAAYIKKDFKTIELAYTQLLNLCPDVSPDPHYRLASILFEKRNTVRL